MASSRKPPSADFGGLELRGRRVVVGLSGGLDSVVLLHLLRGVRRPAGFRLEALHVHHGLSPQAGEWARFCRALCRRWRVPLSVRKVTVRRRGRGLEAAAREARRKAYERHPAQVVALAHHLDDQAETVLLNLLRGAGTRGARGMPVVGALGGKALWRPLLAVPRASLERYARGHRLRWVQDESNADDSLTRNFLRLHVGPLLETRFPRWREALGRVAEHMARADDRGERALRSFLRAEGLRAPSAARLKDMLRQLTGEGARTRIEHDGAVLRSYRGHVFVRPDSPPARFEPLPWRGEARLALPSLGGELRFRRVRGRGIDAARLRQRGLTVGLRGGGERLQPDARRPRRTLKNLFQEAGLPPWERERLPMLYWNGTLVWVPGIGVDAAWQAPAGAPGIVPEWRATS
ncbi:MAG TPA: tRNA lysidine(34) synthetase TilS [Burkholderiales bacterium]|nr:tRNA lysidine(34) synthetase TilS [Burkholderiales bacterium]